MCDKMSCFWFFFFFFKQKTAYEMCGRDWSSDVCSSDLTFFNVLFGPFIMGGLGGIPFSGQTGMTAFAHHIPDGGSALDRKSVV